MLTKQKQRNNMHKLSSYHKGNTLKTKLKNYMLSQTTNFDMYIIYPTDILQVIFLW